MTKKIERKRNSLSASLVDEKKNFVKKDATSKEIESAIKKEKMLYCNKSNTDRKSSASF